MSLPPDVSLLPLWGWGLTLTPKLSLLTQPHDWACRWSSQMAQHTPSQMPMLGRSTSSRWQPRTMRLGRGVTGAWLLTPHPGQRNRGISPPKPRPPVSLSVPLPILPCPTTSCAYALWLLLGAEPLPHTLSGCHRPTICPIPVFLVLVFYMSLVGILGCNRSGWDPALALP